MRSNRPRPRKRTLISARNLETERRLADAANVRGDQADWVIAHLTRGGPLTEAEKRLLKFLVDEAASTPPQLTALLERAA